MQPIIAAPTPLLSREEAVCALLRSADAMIARAVDLLGRAAAPCSAGLPAELVLELDGRLVGTDARALMRVAGLLRSMPHLADAFAAGRVSWSQTRRIAAAVSRLRAEHVGEADALVGRHAGDLCDADPDRLVLLVDDLVARLRADLDVAREDRAVEGSFLSVQARLDGGASWYGESDAQSTATILDALDLVAARAHRAEDDGPTRSQQRFDALVAICDATLAGTPDAPARPRPRLVATVDLSSPDSGEATQVLWALAGRAARLTNVAGRQLWCDATVVPVLFDGAQPVAVGDASHVVSRKVRTALAARDGGCRFPGCRAPAAWSEPHHIVPGYGNTVQHLVLLCRRCHRRVHRFRWKIAIHEDGAITFGYRSRTYTSHPRHRPTPARE